MFIRVWAFNRIFTVHILFSSLAHFVQIKAFSDMA